MRLLILSCGATKVKAVGKVRAIDLYDNPLYHSVRRSIREGRTKDIDIYILSAKHGLMPFDQLIEWYDLKMDESIADTIREEVIRKQTEILKTEYESVFINLSEIYLSTMDKSLFPNKWANQTKYANGPINKRIGQTKEWVRG